MKTAAESKFHAERLSGIGSSDQAAKYNLDEGCRRRLVYKKRATAPDFPERDNPLLERGMMLEPVVLEKYIQVTGHELIPGEFMHHPTHPHSINHPDSLINSPDREGLGLLEAKVAGYHVFRQFKAEGIKDSYILQTQHAMAVRGLNWGAFAVLCPEPWDFLHFPVDADVDMGKELLDSDEALWGQVENGPLPDRLEPTDKRCRTCPFRASCQGDAIEEIPEDHKGKDPLPFENSSEIHELVERVAEVRDIKSEADGAYSEAKQALQDAIGDRPGIQVPGFKCYYKSHHVTRWDTDALAALCEKYPMWAKQMEKYRKTRAQRSLRIYRSKA